MEGIEEVSNRGLVAIYEALFLLCPEGIEESCEEVPLTSQQVRSFKGKYREFATTYGQEHLQLARWFVLRAISRTRVSAADFEASVRDQLSTLSADDDLVFPCGLLAKPIDEPVLHGRLPARPLGGGFDETLTVAHDGLLGHLSQWPALKALPYQEVALSSTVWRAVGIIEDIVDQRGHGDDLHQKVSWLQSHLKNLDSLSFFEQDLGSCLDSDVSRWRNALTHVIRDARDGQKWTFLQAAQHTLTHDAQLLRIGSAVNLAVLDHFAREVSELPVAGGVIRRVERDLEWIHEQNPLL